MLPRRYCWPVPNSWSSKANLLNCRGINKEARDKMQGGHNIFSNDVESRPAGKAGVKVRGHRVPGMHLSTMWGSAAHVLPAPVPLSNRPGDLCVVKPDKLALVHIVCWEGCSRHESSFVACPKLPRSVCN